MKGLFDDLSEREKEILILLAEGFKDKEIADKLFISAGTVNKHKKNMLEKLGLRNMNELYIFAARLKIEEKV
jgi:two-component system, NarL family, response regulator NreC